jgi:hypothetical protein
VWPTTFSLPIPTALTVPGWAGAAAVAKGVCTIFNGCAAREELALGPWQIAVFGGLVDKIGTFVRDRRPGRDSTSSEFDFVDLASWLQDQYTLSASSYGRAIGESGLVCAARSLVGQ